MFFYIENKQYSKTDFEKALEFAKNVLTEDSEIDRIVVLVQAKNKYNLIRSLSTPKSLEKCFSSNDINIKFDTISTYIPAHDNIRDVVIIVGISPLRIQKIEDEYKVKYLIYIPLNMKECISWLREHEAIEISTNKKLEPQFPIKSNVKKAIDWLKETSFPNEGFDHPLDKDRLKALSNVLYELDIPIEGESIIKYCHEIGISYESAYKIRYFFQKAKTIRFRINNNKTLDFLRKMLWDDCLEDS